MMVHQITSLDGGWTSLLLLGYYAHSMSRGWSAVERLVHADFQKCFDHVDQPASFDLLAEQIDDPIFLDPIHKFLIHSILLLCLLLCACCYWCY